MSVRSLAPVRGCMPHAAVDVGAEAHALAVAVEQRRIDHVGQGRADEQRMALQRRRARCSWPRRGGVRALVDLLVELDRRALPAGGDAAVDPGVARLVEPGAQLGQPAGVQGVGDSDQHAALQVSATRRQHGRAAGPRHGAAAVRRDQRVVVAGVGQVEEVQPQVLARLLPRQRRVPAARSRRPRSGRCCWRSGST